MKYKLAVIEIKKPCKCMPRQATMSYKEAEFALRSVKDPSSARQYLKVI